MIARLSRIIPFVIILAVLAGVLYVIMSFRYSSNHAKLLLIKIFTWLNIAFSVVFLLITLYALFEGNQGVVELTGSCLALALIALIVTRICNAIFKKNHPNFGQATSQATIVNPSVASRFAAAFKQALQEALKNTFTNRR